MDADENGLAWGAPSQPIPFDRLQPGVRYHIVIADC